MNIYLIEQYIKKLTKKDVYNFAISNGIKLNSHELDVLYTHLKNDYKTFIYGNQRAIMDEIKKEVEPDTYQKLELLYFKYKDKLNY